MGCYAGFELRELETFYADHSPRPFAAMSLGVATQRLHYSVQSRSWLGGVTIGAGFDYPAVAWIGTFLTLRTLGPALLSITLGRKDSRSATATPVTESPESVA